MYAGVRVEAERRQHRAGRAAAVHVNTRSPAGFDRSMPTTNPSSVTNRAPLSVPVGSMSTSPPRLRPDEGMGAAVRGVGVADDHAAAVDVLRHGFDAAEPADVEDARRRPSR